MHEGGAMRAIGGLPRYESIDQMLQLMDEAGVEKVFITQCKITMAASPKDQMLAQQVRRAEAQGAICAAAKFCEPGVDDQMACWIEEIRILRDGTSIVAQFSPRRRRRRSPDQRRSGSSPPVTEAAG
jgi:predicted TIM-barrel fold metal-dependent hydrolase